MAAYAAVVSLLHVIEHIQLYHARNPIFTVEQLRQLESFPEKVIFLQDFLERFPNGGGNNEAESLEGQIADAAYSAEDILEFHVVHCIHSELKAKNVEEWKLSVKWYKKLTPYTFPGKLLKGYKKWYSNNFSQRLKKVLEKMDFVRKEAMRMINDAEEPRDMSSSADVGSFRRPLTDQNYTTVDIPDHDDKLKGIMDKLTLQQYDSHIISITGMGGIGKTTIAKNVFNHQYIVNHFDIRGWVTVSQEYNERKLFLGILDGIGYHFNDPSEREELDYHQLGDKIYKHLFNRRYLIIVDDLWSIEAWDKIKRFLPDTKGSRILVTTRESKVANNLDSSGVYEMNLLDDNSSWILLSRIVFGQESCPLELDEIGRKIAKNCKGLPLSISVIGGLLVKSQMKLQFWEHISKEISKTVNSEGNESCLKTLSLSYYHLPTHLRPCFLYMGIFPEDYEVRVSELIRLWVAEGFLKPNKCRSLEEVAKDYFVELVERNLILVSKVGSTGNIKKCRIHDLLWDFCLREGQKHRFLYTPSMQQMCNSSRGIHDARRIASLSRNLYKRFIPCIVKESFARSVLKFTNHVPSLRKFILLRVFSSSRRSGGDWSLLVNLRYIGDSIIESFPSSINLFWNLHTIRLSGVEDDEHLPIEIWKMPQLRHIKVSGGIGLRYPEDGQLDRQDIFVLQNLQTLGTMRYFKCTEEILRRIPNIKKLKILYPVQRDLLYSCLNNLSRFNRLQSLICDCFGNYLPHEIQFPLSLKKLSLRRIKSEEIITQKVGSLPNLEKLRLDDCNIGGEWNPVEGQFQKLKYLELRYVEDLRYWNAESIHFPSLEHLVLGGMENFEEIPFGIGEIDTLRSIKLYRCSSAIVASAERIIKEQKDNGNEDLCLQVTNIGLEWEEVVIAAGGRIF